MRKDSSWTQYQLSYDCLEMYPSEFSLAQKALTASACLFSVVLTKSSWEESIFWNGQKSTSWKWMNQYCSTYSKTALELVSDWITKLAGIREAILFRCLLNFQSVFVSASCEQRIVSKNFLKSVLSIGQHQGINVSNVRNRVHVEDWSGYKIFLRPLARCQPHFVDSKATKAAEKLENALYAAIFRIFTCFCLQNKGRAALPDLFITKDAKARAHCWKEPFMVLERRINNDITVFLIL